MKRQLQGIALILFGILLAIFASFDLWLPGGVGTYITDLAMYVSVIVGVIGLFVAFKKDK